MTTLGKIYQTLTYTTQHLPLGAQYSWQETEGQDFCEGRRLTQRPQQNHNTLSPSEPTEFGATKKKKKKTTNITRLWVSGQVHLFMQIRENKVASLDGVLLTRKSLSARCVSIW